MQSFPKHVVGLVRHSTQTIDIDSYTIETVHSDVQRFGKVLR